MALNLVSQIIVFMVSMGINFILTPFILKSLGNEAYGFVGLTNAIVSYAAVITLAINSMAGRFVAYEWHRGDVKTANCYYSSVIASNVFFTILVLILSSVFILNLELFLDVPKHLKDDVRLTFLFYFLNFCVGLFNAIFSVAIFLKNKLFLLSIRNAISSLILALLIFLLFLSFRPLIAYIAISALIASIFVLFSTLRVAKKITPELKFSISNFSFNAIKTLLKSGIFTSFNALNRILLTGMDLFIANVYLGANMTGILAVSKATPIVAESFVAQISGIFTPKFIEIFSKNDTALLVKEAIFSVRLTAFLIIAPICVFVVFGREFYTLWLSFKDQSEIGLIYEISMITLVPILLISFVFPLFNIDTATNKLMRPAVANTILGVGTILSQIAILKFTNYGIYGIVVVGAVLYSLRIFIFDPINAALNLNLKLSTFYPPILRSIFIFSVILGVMFCAKNYAQIDIKIWSEFVFYSLLFAVFGYFLSLVFLFSKSEQFVVINFIKSKLKRR